MKLLPHYLEERALKPNSAISIVDNSNVLPLEESIAISKYMRSCLVIDEWLSPNQDPLDKSKWIPESTWSDGKYVWHEAHIHFIEQYRVRVPQDFYVHVKQQIEQGFDAATLDKSALQEEYKKISGLQVKRDESVYDLSY